jgi:hypothetical protein
MVTAYACTRNPSQLFPLHNALSLLPPPAFTGRFKGDASCSYVMIVVR